jgi:hypothetical protein
VVAELELSPIDDYLGYVAPLYRRALMTRYGRIGGLDDYLTEKFLNCEPTDFAAALRRLRMAWEHAGDLGQANPPEPEEQVQKVEVRVALFPEFHCVLLQEMLTDVLCRCCAYCILQTGHCAVCVKGTACTCSFACA